MSAESLYPPSHQTRRFIESPSERLQKEDYRLPWRVDYARVLHSACFRRLQGKNQLLPSTDSDFFRNRLTHSLEVAQISHSIAVRINEDFIKDPELKLNVDLCQVSALCHDLGHPPFGHQGEHALNVKMKDHGGFEGNAQTFRIISKLEKKFQDNFEGKDADRFGLNLTYRTLASVVKYDDVIPEILSEQTKYKGIYSCDDHIRSQIKEVLDIKGDRLYTIETQIMDIADDIAYSTYDLEDAFKGGFLSPMSVCFPSNEVLQNICVELSKITGTSFGYANYAQIVQELFGDILPSGPSSSLFEDVQEAYTTAKFVKENSYYRTKMTSYFVGLFIRGISLEYFDQERPWLSKIRIDPDTKLKIELLKKVTLYSIIDSPKMKARNFQAEHMVFSMFDSIIDRPSLMPIDIFEIHDAVDEKLKPRIVCDFIAGMTDKYAFEFYRRLYHPSNKSFFEPHW